MLPSAHGTSIELQPPPCRNSTAGAGRSAFIGRETIVRSRIPSGSVTWP